MESRQCREKAGDRDGMDDDTTAKHPHGRGNVAQTTDDQKHTLIGKRGGVGMINDIQVEESCSENCRTKEPPD